MRKIIFTQEENKNILELYKTKSCKEIGKLYNCSKQVINKLLRANKIYIKNNSEAHMGNCSLDINKNIFENIDSHEKAYWLGMLAGDGYNHGNTISLGLAEKDKEHVYKFKKFMNSGHKVIRIINKKLKKDGTQSITYRISIYNKKISDDLNKLGIGGNKTINLKFPNIDEKYYSSFCLGLVDADGSFPKSKTKNILRFNVCGTFDVMTKVKEVLVSNCKISNLELNETNTSFLFVVSYGGTNNIYKICKFLYSNNLYSLYRKRKRVMDFLISKFPNDEWVIEQSKLINLEKSPATQMTQASDSRVNIT